MTGESSRPPVDASPAATETRSAEPSRTFPCENCGGDLRFNIEAQRLRCPYCGATTQLSVDPASTVQEQDYGARLAKLAELREKARPDQRGFREVVCDGCGARVRFEGTLTSRECGYCGTPLQLDAAREAEERVPVDAVVPFGIDRDSAAESLRRWVRSRWFAPNEFLRRGAQGKFNGIYLPYWTFDSMTDTHFTGRRGDHYWVSVGSGKKRRRVRRTRWREVSGRFRRFFDDVLVVAARGLPLARLRALEPWPLDRAIPFDRGLLAGFLARTYDVGLAAGFDEARGTMEQALRGEVRRRIGGDVQQIRTMNTVHAAVTFKHLLLPVWLMAYRFRDGTYQVVVNAATGEVQGDRPWSSVKLALAAAAAVIVAGLCWYFLRR